LNIEHSSRLWLPRTGLTTSYAAGDDGYFQAGNPRKTRFVDNGNGTISDRATGLTWVKEPGACGGAFGSAGSPLPMTWATAVAECLGLTYGGFSDWRLPNAIELVAMYDFSVGGSGTAWPTIFPGAQAYAYWSGNSWKAYTPYAFFVNFLADAGANLSVSAKTTATFFVRPVRGGRLNANG
jgi:hypothetical protein